ncbi:MAG: hypothetical protein AAFW97_16255 [Pseudomonadota bacterium]
MSDTLLYVFIAIVVVILIVVLIRTRGRTHDGAAHHDSVSDSLASAVEDVVGEFTGVEANPDFAGDTGFGRPSSDGSGGGASTARGGAGDELTRIKGLGPKAEAKLKGFGVARFEQIASWTPGDIATIDAKLGSKMAERIERDRWVEQAGLLARGEIKAFEEKFGKLG